MTLRQIAVFLLQTEMGAGEATALNRRIDAARDAFFAEHKE